MIDRKAFFDHVRGEPFGGSLSAAQVAGMSAVLDVWDKSGFTDPRWLAYCLATSFHETGKAMVGVKEIGEGRGHSYGLPAGPYDHIYFGRGLLQLTWLAGYENATIKLKARGFDLDLVKNPDDALKTDVGAEILIFGMAEGWFTGRRLSTYFNDTSDDPVNARHIINGLDRAEMVAGYHRAFLTAIKTAAVPPTPELDAIRNAIVREAAVQASAKPASVPAVALATPPAVTQPSPKPLQPETWLRRLGAWLRLPT